MLGKGGSDDLTVLQVKLARKRQRRFDAALANNERMAKFDEVK